MQVLPVPAPSSSSAPLTSVIYVVGEVLISLAVICGAFYLMLAANDNTVKVAAGTSLGATTTFWFTRRQSEQSNNALATLANGKLTQLLQSQQAIQNQTGSLLSLMGTTARSSASSADAAASSAEVARHAVASINNPLVAAASPATAAVATAMDKPAWMVAAEAAGWGAPGAS